MVASLAIQFPSFQKTTTVRICRPVHGAQCSDNTTPALRKQEKGYQTSKCLTGLKRGSPLGHDAAKEGAGVAAQRRSTTSIRFGRGKQRRKWTAPRASPAASEPAEPLLPRAAPAAAAPARGGDSAVVGLRAAALPAPRCFAACSKEEKRGGASSGHRELREWCCARDLTKIGTRSCAGWRSPQCAMAAGGLGGGGLRVCHCDGAWTHGSSQHLAG
ncbi:unnamed protein product [Urochloa humidicola]